MFNQVGFSKKARFSRLMLTQLLRRSRVSLGFLSFMVVLFGRDSVDVANGFAGRAGRYLKVQYRSGAKLQVCLNWFV
jgi:hypothetical protein